MTKISFNGQDYDSPEAMPPDVRQLYYMITNMLADTNQDGQPDIFASSAIDGTPTMFQFTR